MIEEGHSRIPVYESSVDEIVGILYAKDLLPFLKAGDAERPALRTLLRTPVFVPESMSVDDLLHELQRRKVHIAIVLDEYGGTAGLVTIEDLIEEIVGEIQDEYDEEEPMIVELSDDEARVDGRAAVDDLGSLFDTDLALEDDDEYDTVGGLIYHRIGGVPKPGDQVSVDGLTLTVETTDGRRVGKVLVVRNRAEWRRRGHRGRRGGSLMRGRAMRRLASPLVAVALAWPILVAMPAVGRRRVRCDARALPAHRRRRRAGLPRHDRPAVRGRDRPRGLHLRRARVAPRGAAGRCDPADDSQCRGARHQRLR